MCICAQMQTRGVYVCVCIRSRFSFSRVPLPGEERGLLTSPWSRPPAGQDSALTLIRFSLTGPETDEKDGMSAHVQ